MSKPKPGDKRFTAEVPIVNLDAAIDITTRKLHAVGINKSRASITDTVRAAIADYVARHEEQRPAPD